MKKNLFTAITTMLVTLLLVVVSSTVITSCTDLFNQNKDEIEMLGLEITSYPTKTNYNRGDTLDLSGLAVVAVYSDGSRSGFYNYTTTPAEGEVLNETGSVKVIVEKVILKPRETRHIQASFYIEVR